MLLERNTRHSRIESNVEYAPIFPPHLNRNSNSNCDLKCIGSYNRLNPNPEKNRWWVQTLVCVRVWECARALLWLNTKFCKNNMCACAHDTTFCQRNSQTETIIITKKKTRKNNCIYLIIFIWWSYYKTSEILVV